MRIMGVTDPDRPDTWKVLGTYSGLTPHGGHGDLFRVVLHKPISMATILPFEVNENVTVETVMVRLLKVVWRRGPSVWSTRSEWVLEFAETPPADIWERHGFQRHG